MLLQGDSKELLKTLPDNSVDAIVTDPPYGLSFMGKKWDYDVPSEEIWRECLRVLKPGGYLLSFAGTRTQHRMAVRIEDAGFEIRDMIAWVYGSGFPKSLNIGKAVDKLQGNERGWISKSPFQASEEAERASEGKCQSGRTTHPDITKGTSEWEGWGTALKPALEPITVARKPIEKTVAENCLKWGVGGINIDGCRVGTEEELGRNNHTNPYSSERTWSVSKTPPQNNVGKAPFGRFPANLIHDGSDEVVGLFPKQKSSGNRVNVEYKNPNKANVDFGGGIKNDYNDSGSASRFFYCAKASKAERNRGLENFEEVRSSDGQMTDGVGGENPRNRTNTPKQNFHPTVKPIALMEYLIKLVSKEGHTILDPFAGSGSTLIAAKKLKREFIGIELDPEYIKIAEARLASVDDTLF